MDYSKLFEERIASLHREGRYRVFADLERRAGAFPRADACTATGDARGHGLVLQRLSRHGPASDRAGGDARGDRRGAAPAPAAPATSPAPTTITCCWSASWPTCTARKRRCCSPPAMSPTRRRSSTLAKLLPGCVDLLRRAEPRLDDRGHPPSRRREADFPPQRSGRPRSAAGRPRPGRAEAGRLRERLFDGRRHRADRRDLRRRRAARRA